MDRFTDAERQALEAKTITIDLMLLYTKDAADHYLGEPAGLLADWRSTRPTRRSRAAGLATSACGSCTPS